VGAINDKSDTVFRNAKFAADHRHPRLKAFTALQFTITMSGSDPHRLAASLRRLGGRQDRHPDIRTGPGQLEGEHTVDFATLRHPFGLIIGHPAFSDAIASTETRD